MGILSQTWHAHASLTLRVVSDRVQFNNPYLEYRYQVVVNCHSRTSNWLDKE